MKRTMRVGWALVAAWAVCAPVFAAGSGTTPPPAPKVHAPDATSIKDLNKRQAAERKQFNKDRKADMKALEDSIKSLPADQQKAQRDARQKDWEQKRKDMMDRQKAERDALLKAK